MSRSAAYQRLGVDESFALMTAPREAIANSQLDDHTRHVLLTAYDRLQREFGMDEETAMKVVDRLLALADAGERSYSILLQKASLMARQGVERDTEQEDTGH